MIDAAQAGRAFSYPGIDPRQWFSYGIVDPESGDQHSVRFNDDSGSPLPTGALVSVTLMPSGVPVQCRVAQMAAGAGEGAWSPIGPGDEVIVGIPQGDERAGCVILGKLNNSQDVMPQAVAGQDVTQNNVNFLRLKSPYLLETAASWMVRSALTGASGSIDPTGTVLWNSGDGHLFSMSSDVILLQESSGTALLQIDPSKLQVSLQADATSFIVDANASTFLTPGTLAIGTSGLNATGNAVTTQQVVGLILNFIAALALQGAFNPAGPFGAAAWAVPSAAQATILALLPTIFPACVAPTAYALNGAPGGDFTATALIPLLATALLSQPPDPAGLLIPLPAPMLPGIGKPGLTF